MGCFQLSYFHCSPDRADQCPTAEEHWQERHPECIRVCFWVCPQEKGYSYKAVCFLQYWVFNLCFKWSLRRPTYKREKGKSNCASISASCIVLPCLKCILCFHLLRLVYSDVNCISLLCDTIMTPTYVPILKKIRWE